MRKRIAEESRAFLANISYYEVTDTDFDFSEGILDVKTTFVDSSIVGNTTVPTWYQETEGPEMIISSFHSDDFAIILMSPDAGLINCQIQVGASLPILGVVATALLVFGGLLMMVSIFLMAWGATAKRIPRDMPLDRVRYYKAI